MKGIEGLLAGRTLAGRYRIEEVIGRGGFAAVYRARDETLQRTVAVKVITVSAPDAESRRRLRARFHREARAAARLQHPGVVTIFDFGTDSELELDFLVMELLHGEDLAARMAAGPLPLPEALQVVREAAEGLAAGHRAGLIHRDVKPGNLFLVRREDGGFTVKVLDFGIAQLETGDDTLTQLTHGGHALSPAYASPEQLRGERPLSPATDVYSLGVLAYELLSGERLFGRGGDPRRRGPVPPLRERRPEVPAGVAAEIERAMDPDPSARHPDAGVLAAALGEAPGGGAPDAASERRVLPPVYRARKRPRLPEEPPSPVPRRSAGSPLLLALLVLLVGAAGIGWWALRQGRASGAPPPEPVVRVEAPREEPPAPVAEPEPGDAGGVEAAPAGAGAGSSWSRNALALHDEGVERLGRGDHAGAVQRLRDAVRLEPGNAAFRNNLAWALFRAGEVDEAARELEGVLRDDPGRAIAYANLGEVRLAQGDTTAAIAAYRRFLELNADARRGGIARRRLAELGAG